MRFSSLPPESGCIYPRAGWSSMNGDGERLKIASKYELLSSSLSSLIRTSKRSSTFRRCRLVQHERRRRKVEDRFEVRINELHDGLNWLFREVSFSRPTVQRSAAPTAREIVAPAMTKQRGSAARVETRQMAVQQERPTGNDCCDDAGESQA